MYMPNLSGPDALLSLLKNTPTADYSFRTLLASTEKQPEILGMTGHDRMLLYWLGAETGLRWTELKSLTTLPFEIAEAVERPFVRILAKDAKNGEDREQPVTHKLAKRLRDYLADKAPMEPAFPMPADGAEAP